MTENENHGLVEIKDKSQINKIVKSLNMNFKDNFMVSPFILGSVVNGGFERKLRMLRCDLWTLLSVSESFRFVKSTL